jgi:hypothetical protein
MIGRATFATSFVHTLALAAALVSLPTARAHAQSVSRAADSTIAARFDRGTALVLTRIVDSARAQGLPSHPLVTRALEGASRHIPDARIIAVVRAYAQALRNSRTALGTQAPTDELVAGADVLLAGVTSKALTELRSTRETQPLTVPLVVLADLVARGVPTTDAASAVITVARTNAPDAKFLELQRTVANDITSGASPAGALALRVQGITQESPANAPAHHPTPAHPPVQRSRSFLRNVDYGTLFSIDARAWTTHGSDAYPVRPSVTAGAWIRQGHVSASLSVEEGINVVNSTNSLGTDSIISSPFDTSSRIPSPGGMINQQSAFPAARPITDVTAALQWSTHRFSAQTFAGARFGNAVPARSRFGVDLAYAVSNLFALTARLEHLPQRDVSFARGTNFALGLRVLSLPSVWHHNVTTPVQAATQLDVVPAPQTHMATLRVRAPHAKSVELIGDMTNWEPAALVRTADDWWELPTPIPPGVHHLNIRVDHGAWTPPPTIPSVRDPYAGLVGVLVIYSTQSVSKHSPASPA